MPSTASTATMARRGRRPHPRPQRTQAAAVAGVAQGSRGAADAGTAAARPRHRYASVRGSRRSPSAASTAARRYPRCWFRDDLHWATQPRRSDRTARARLHRARRVYETLGLPGERAWRAPVRGAAARAPSTPGAPSRFAGQTSARTRILATQQQRRGARRARERRPVRAQWRGGGAPRAAVREPARCCAPRPPGARAFGRERRGRQPCMRPGRRIARHHRPRSAETGVGVACGVTEVATRSEAFGHVVTGG